MDKETLKKYRELTREFVEHVCATDEQLEYLIKQYSDTDCVLGIHNTEVDYDNIFKVGLQNQTDMGVNADDIANTVYYSKILCSLAMYPNGDGEKRGRTAIIVKIPKKVFTHEQGIFETLPDGSYFIPTQYIVGAFSEGTVVDNPNYQKGYNNPEAIKCDDPDYNNNDVDKPIQIEAFKKEYKRYKSGSIIKRVANFIERIKGRKKQTALPPAKVDRNKNESQAYKETLKRDFVAASEHAQSQDDNVNREKISDSDIQNNIQDR